MSTRRRFIRRATYGLGSLAAAGPLGRFGLMNAFAAPSTTSSSTYRALVCVFLYGGNDTNNMIVPLDAASFKQYTTIRQNLALAQNTLLPVQTASKAVYGLHPKLTDLQTLFNSKELALVANVGSLVQPLTRAQYLANQASVPSNLFSHSDQQMQWQTSVTNGSITTTGWAGRVADQVGHMNSPSTFPTFVTVTGTSIMGTGQQTRPASVIPGATLGLRGFDTSAAATARMTGLQEILTLDSGVTLVHQAETLMSDGLKDSATLSKAMSGAVALKTVFPKTSLGSQLEEVAKLIQVRQSMGMSRQIFFCSLGGFDTHTAQLATQDSLYSQVGPALGAFFAATQELGVQNDVTTFTESDFSRTLQPNTNGGTDHAWGSHHMVMGGAVKGGNLYGQFPALELNSTNDAGGEGRWIPTTAIDQYGATLATWFGVPAQNLGSVFPNLSKFTSQNLGFV